MSDKISVEVVLALRASQSLMTVSLQPGATAAEAIEQSGIRDRFPDIDTSNSPIGVWGHVVDHDHRLCDGDRVEIYRPLEIDPRESRRRLALAGRTMSQSKD